MVLTPVVSKPRALPALVAMALSIATASALLIGCGRSSPGMRAEAPREDPLIAAVSAGNAEEVRELIRQGADVDSRDAQEHPALEHALGKPEMVKLLVAAGADVNARVRMGSVFDLAVMRNSDSAMILLEAGAKPSGKFGPERLIALGLDAQGQRQDELFSVLLRQEGPRRYPPELVERLWREKELGILAELLGYARPWPGQLACTALVSGRSDLIAVLPRQVLDIDGRCQHGTPLTAAARAKDVTGMRALLDLGANPDVVDPDRKTALMVAVETSQPDVIRLLLERKANPNQVVKGPRGTPLLVALGTDDLTSVAALLAGGADPMLPDEQGAVPLLAVILDGRDQARDLMTGAAKGGRPDRKRVSSYLSRVPACDVDKVEALLALGADARTGAPLIEQVYCEDQRAFDRLRAAGADINAARPDGTTALMDAAGGRDVERVDRLLGLGARLEQKDSAGETALFKAVRVQPVDKRNSPLNRLLDAGAKVNATDNRGRTPLMVAVEDGELTAAPSWTADEIVARLVERGADPEHRDKEGRTAFDHYARFLARHGRRAEVQAGLRTVALTIPAELERESDRSGRRIFEGFDFRHLTLTVTALGPFDDDFSDVQIPGALDVRQLHEEAGGRLVPFVSFEPSRLDASYRDLEEEMVPALGYGAIVKVDGAKLLLTVESTVHWKTEMRWILRAIARAAAGGS